ncbi:zinc-dependent metalloprotease [Shewanella saliphila]|uniref:Periplasmic metalloprotease n=1 Tax=Shewanella saliphila TaxID=2282698 RepID=A0ABQ2Q3C9_9GAMM|nr:zinc-dependent metalloprotease [Shewanella saliphila]MCL1101451.1 zinc-dependent metalloprotease [Shewanella saliphila]GGP46658.1 periplasmic metalloprotease [Shewanella saliphila]
MIRRSIPLALLLAIAPATFLSDVAVAASDPAQKIIKQAQTAEGFINLFYDAKAGQLYLEANKLNQPFLMLTSLPHGVGSNDIGLDRGQLGRTRMVQFEQHGPYLILKQLNTDYRASSDNFAEQQAVTQAFAESILWRGKLVEGKKAIVAINDLVINDLHGVADVLEARKQGQYHLDPERSVILPEGIKSFERNADVDVNLTFNTSKAGKQVAEVTPDAKFLSVRLRYSFVQLPDEGFEPRNYHPMSGYLSDQYIDYSAAVDQPHVQRHLRKHRLQKVTPGDAPSQVVEPIVYYVDPGVPEPIRGALLAGARWWQDAFTAAGFIDGFKVELLPEGADPQDVRYNMIQWVHRATRGWSYGAAVTDPRTGEIIKGNVTLGSLRVRQDHLIARGLTAGWPDRQAASEAAMALSLARIRQLAAHEIGHTLGLDHNFAASTNSNASVMDYPHPYASIEGDQIDISQPYREGIGEWDKYTIAYGYGSPSQMDSLLASTLESGFRYIGEADSRQASASHAYASLWDRGNDAVAELQRLETVRLKAITEFNSDALLAGDPKGELADVFVPIYLLTRYQIEAAAKWIGGADYSYQQVGSGVRWSYVPPKMQLAALDTLLNSLQSRSLVIPTNVVQALVPKAGNYRKTRESFGSNLGVVSDPATMAEMLSRHIVSVILTPERLNRVNQAYMEDSTQLSVVKLIDKLAAASLYQDLPNGSELAIQMRVNTVVVDAMLAAYHDEKTAPEVKAQLVARFDYIVKQLKRRSNRGSDYQSAHYDWLYKGIVKGLEQPEFTLISKPVAMPPGSPI